jgi:hypothetical protein
MEQPVNIFWRRPSPCESGNCVEVAFIGDQVMVRDSKNADGPVLRFSFSEWESFLNCICQGDFDSA